MVLPLIVSGMSVFSWDNKMHRFLEIRMHTLWLKNFSNFTLAIETHSSHVSGRLFSSLSVLAVFSSCVPSCNVYIRGNRWVGWKILGWMQYYLIEKSTSHCLTLFQTGGYLFFCFEPDFKNQANGCYYFGYFFILTKTLKKLNSNKHLFCIIKIRQFIFDTLKYNWISLLNVNDKKTCSTFNAWCGDPFVSQYLLNMVGFRLKRLSNCREISTHWVI